ncbi:MAG: VOC family protein [Pseudomonadota bacterium]
MTYPTHRRSFLYGAAMATTGAALPTGTARAQDADVAAARAASLSTAPAGGVEGALVQSQTFDHVCLSATDLDRVADWYKRVFGFVETHRFALPDYVGVPATLAYLRLGNLQLEIFGNPDAAEGRPEPMSFPETIAYTGFQHFCVRVDDMDATIEALQSAGIPIFLGPNTNTTLNRTFIHIKDPEGNDVEIVKWEG